MGTPCTPPAGSLGSLAAGVSPTPPCLPPYVDKALAVLVHHAAGPWCCNPHHWCSLLHSISHLLISLCSPYRLFKLSSLFHTPLNPLESASSVFVFSITVLGHIPSDVWTYLLTYTYSQPSPVLSAILSKARGHIHR